PGRSAADAAGMVSVRGDLAALPELDEASLLRGLRERFLRQLPYTDIGDILIAMNPFQPLPLYGPDVSHEHRPASVPSCLPFPPLFPFSFPPSSP
ncbi:MYO1A protein, partial [Piaya cayana]|nr:MYO1A protein [Piaya cayana]